MYTYYLVNVYQTTIYINISIYLYIYILESIYLVYIYIYCLSIYLYIGGIHPNRRSSYGTAWDRYNF